MAQWLTIVLAAALVGVVCAWKVEGRRGLLLSVGAAYCAVLVWQLMSAPGDLAWPIALFWVGSVAAAVSGGTYALCRRAFRKAA